MKNCYLRRELAVYQLSEFECLGVCCRVGLASSKHPASGKHSWGSGRVGKKGRVAGRECPVLSEEKNNLAVGAGMKHSQGPARGYVKQDKKAHFGIKMCKENQKNLG